MEHLPIDFVGKIELGGPNHLCYMYPMERELCEFKDLVRNWYNQESSIVEGFYNDPPGHLLNICVFQTF